MATGSWAPESAPGLPWQKGPSLWGHLSGGQQGGAWLGSVDEEP